MKHRKYIYIPAIFKKGVLSYLNSETKLPGLWCSFYVTKKDGTEIFLCKFCRRLMGPLVGSDLFADYCPCDETWNFCDFYGSYIKEKFYDDCAERDIQKWAKLLPIKFVGKERISCLTLD